MRFDVSLVFLSCLRAHEKMAKAFLASAMIYSNQCFTEWAIPLPLAAEAR